MSRARFQIVHAGPLVSFQDGGRPGHMRFGVSASGPMDRLSLSTANLALGNDSHATAVEVSMGGLVLKCLTGSVGAAVVGGQFQIAIDDREIPGGSVLNIEAGQQISIRPGASGSWCYLAIAGTVNVPQWLGHAATHALSGLGGGLLRTGDTFEVNDCHRIADVREPIASAPLTSFGGHVRVVMGPQDQQFSSAARRDFLSCEFTLSNAYDRMGVRLEGPPLEIEGSLSIPSEPVLKGSVQVAGDGNATVLLADHQTTGGYPKIATVIGADLDEFAQLRPRQKIRFHAILPQDAVTLARVREIELRSYFEAIKLAR